MRCISLANVWHISPKEAIREVHETSTFFKGSNAIISLLIGTTITHYRTEHMFQNGTTGQLILSTIIAQRYGTQKEKECNY